MNHTPVPPDDEIVEVSVEHGDELRQVSRAFRQTGRVLLASTLAGLAMVLIDRQRGISGLVPLTFAFGTAVAGAILLAADRRAPIWISAARSLRTDPPPALTRTDLGLLGALTLAALIPRCIAARHSLIVDELWTLSFVRHGPLYALTHQSEYNNHPLNSVLCSLLLKARSALLGAPSPDDLSWYPLMRAPSVLFGTLSAPLLYLAARPHLPRPTCLLAALLLALSPVAVDVSAQSRGYSAMICLTLAMVPALCRAVRTAEPVAWLLWLTWATLASLAHLYSGFAVLAGALCVGAVGLRSADRTERRCRLEQAVLLPTAWGLLTLAGLSGVLGVMRAALKTEASRPIDARMDQVLLPMLQRWGGSIHGVTAPFYYVLCGLLLGAGLLLLRRTTPIVGLYCALLLFLPPIVVEAIRPHFVFMRFFVVALPAFLVCLACGITQIALPARTGPAISSWRFAVPAIAVTLWSAVRLVPVLMLPKQDYLHAVQYLKQAQHQGAVVATLGVGYQYFNQYRLTATYAESAAVLDACLRAHGSVLLVDTGIRVHPLPITLQRYLQQHAGPPIAVFPSRFADWPSRWRDEESDFTVYRIRSTPAP